MSCIIHVLLSVYVFNLALITYHPLPVCPYKFSVYMLYSFDDNSDLSNLTYYTGDEDKLRMPKHDNLSEFNTETEDDWPSYIEQMNHYFIANDIASPITTNQLTY